MLPKLKLLHIHWPPPRVSWDPAQIRLLMRLSITGCPFSLPGCPFSLPGRRLLVSSWLGGSKPVGFPLPEKQ